MKKSDQDGCDNRSEGKAAVRAKTQKGQQVVMSACDIAKGTSINYVAGQGGGRGSRV